MVKKKTLIAGLVLIICLLVIFTCFLVAGDVFNNSSEKLDLSDTCSCMVPTSHSATLNQKDTVKAYEDTDNNLTVVHFNAKSTSGKELMNSVVNKTLVGDVRVIDGVSVHYDAKTGMYSIFVACSDTNDCVLIASKDIDLLLKVYNSLTFNGIPIAEDSHITHDLSILGIQENNRNVTATHTNATAPAKPTNTSSGGGAGQPEGHVDRSGDFD